MTDARALTPTTSHAISHAAGHVHEPRLPSTAARLAEPAGYFDGETRLVLAAPDLSLVSPMERDDCRIAAAEFDRLLRPAELDRIVAWLKPINAGIKGSLGQVDLTMKARAIGMLEMPAACFTADAQREGLTRWQFFPSAAEVRELLEPQRRRWERSRDACRQVADSRPREAEAFVPPTPEQRAAAIGTAKRLKAELDAARPIREAEKARARHSSDGALLVEYERMAAAGGACAGAARTRADMIRARLRVGELVG